MPIISTSPPASPIPGCPRWHGGQRDAIGFFLDAFNDKQTIFNSQHRQFRVALDGALFERGGRSTGVKQALLMVPGGYQLEMSIPWSNLGITPVADQTVIGLDRANDDSVPPPPASITPPSLFPILPNCVPRNLAMPSSPISPSPARADRCSVRSDLVSGG